MLPYDQIAEPALLADLAQRQVDILVAVTPATVARAGRLVARCRDAGVGIGLWPMVDDRQGRWPSAANAAPFVQFCRRLMDSLRAARAMPDEIAIDLEPPIQRARAILAGSPRALFQLPDPAGMRALEAFVRELREERLRVSAAVTPLAVLPSALASRGWQSLLGTTLDRLTFDAVNAMAYTSLFEGYSRGLLRRADARALLRAIAAACAGRWASRAAISLGVVGPGALGDERAYRTPRELAEDVALAQMAGVDEVVLFALDGVLARPPRQLWLDALCGRDPASVADVNTARARAALAAGSAIGVLAAGIGRLCDQRDIRWLRAPVITSQTGNDENSAAGHPAHDPT